MSFLKKLFFFSLFIFFLSLLFWGVYNLSFKKDSNSSLSKEQEKSLVSKKDEEEDASLKVTPPPILEKISAISDEPVIAPVISTNSSSIKYFSKNTGEAFKIDFDGTAKNSLSSKNPGLIKASWSIEKDKAILKIKNPDGSPSSYFYDFANGEKFELNKNIEDVAWQTNANRIFYTYFDPASKKRTLNVSDPDGKNWINLINVPYEKVSFYQVPKSGALSFWNSGDAYNQTIFQSVPMTGGSIKDIDRIGFGNDYLWDFSGNNFLVSHSDAKGGYKIELGIANYNGGEFRNLGIPTFVSKCAWSKNGKIVYYALPGEIPDNTVLPNEYKEGKFNTADTFWKIDIETGEKTRLLETKEIKEKYDVSRMFLSPDESFLFFVNKINEKLYRLAL